MEKNNSEILDSDNLLKFLQNINYLPGSIETLLNKKQLLESPLIEIDDLDSTNLQNAIIPSVGEDNDNKNNLHNFHEMADQCKRIYSLDIDLPLLYEIYRGVDNKMHRNTYTFTEFHNLFKLLNCILDHFNQDMLKIEIKKVWNENVTVFIIDDNEPINYFKTECNKYFSDHKSLDLEEVAVSVYKNILFIFYIFTMCGRLSFNLPSSKLKIENFVMNVQIYNKLYISHINYLLLVHLMMVALYHISLNEELKNNTGNLIFGNSQKNKLSIKGGKSSISFNNNVTLQSPTYFYYENITNKNLEDEVLIVSLIATNLKYYLIPFLPDNISINVKTITYDFFNSTMFYYEYSSPEVNSSLTFTKNFNLSLHDLNMINQKNFKLEEFFLSIWKGIVFYELQNMMKKYEGLIMKTKNLVIKDVSGNGGNYLLIENFTNEMDLLEGTLQFIHRVQKAKKKKKEEFYYFINLNFFELFLKNDFSILNMNSSAIGKNKNVITKSITIEINYVNIQEEELLGYMCQISGYSKVCQNLKNLLSNLKLFKKHNLNLTVSKSPFENEELSFIFNLLALTLHNYGEEKGIKNLCVNETNKYISSKHTLVLNNVYKEKNKKSIFQKFLKNLQNPTLNVFWKYADRLLLFFQEVIINDFVDNNYTFTSSALLRNFKNNKIIIRNYQDNTYAFDIYLHESGKVFYGKIGEFIKSLKSNLVISNLIREITVVMSKNYFEEVMNKEYFNSPATKDMYSLVDKFYIVNLEADYDIYVLEKRICLILHKPIAFQSKNSLTKEHQKEFNIKKVIYEFSKILVNDMKSVSTSPTKSSLEILLKTKEKFFSHFNFVYKSHKASSIKVIDLCEGHFSINKIPQKSAENNNTYTKRIQLSEIFSNPGYLKKVNLLPLFILSFKNFNFESIKNTNNLNKTNAFSNIILPLQEFLIERAKTTKMFTPVDSEMEKTKYINTNTQGSNNLEIEVTTQPNNQRLVDQVNVCTDIFFEYLSDILFVDHIKHFSPVIFSTKHFFNLLKICKNFYKMNKGQLFSQIYIIPLKDDEKVANFISEMGGYYNMDRNDKEIEMEVNFLVTRRILFYETDRKTCSYDLISQTLPFQNSKIETSIKLIETTYEKEKNSGQKIGSEITLEVFRAKSHLLDALVKEVLAEKGEKINRDKIQQLNQLDKIGRENPTIDENQIQVAYQKTKKKTKNKKCIIF